MPITAPAAGLAYQCVTWFLFCLTDRYSAFSGRAGRREYWSFTAVYIVLHCIAALIDKLLGLRLFGFGLLSGPLFLVLVVPGLAVGVRRLHDLNKSGWFYLLAFVPIIHFYLLYLLLCEGTGSDNAYGPVSPERQGITSVTVL